MREPNGGQHVAGLEAGDDLRLRVSVETVRVGVRGEARALSGQANNNKGGRRQCQAWILHTSILSAHLVGVWHHLHHHPLAQCVAPQLALKGALLRRRLLRRGGLAALGQQVPARGNRVFR